MFVYRAKIQTSREDKEDACIAAGEERAPADHTEFGICMWHLHFEQ